MAAMTYVASSKKFETMDMPDGTTKSVMWREISKLHFDPKIRAQYPGWWARNPANRDVVFFYKDRREGGDG